MFEDSSRFSCETNLCHGNQVLTIQARQRREVRHRFLSGFDSLINLFSSPQDQWFLLGQSILCKRNQVDVSMEFIPSKTS